MRVRRPIHAPDPVYGRETAGDSMPGTMPEWRGYDTEMFGAHYKTLYWADAPVSDERLMEEHRFIYQSQFSPERYARYVQIPRDPLAGPPCQVPWDE